MTDIREEAAEVKEELETAVDVMEEVITKLDQFIEGEITEEEYNEWVEASDELFEQVNI